MVDPRVGVRPFNATLDEIKALLSNGESETLEFEETTGTRREAIVMVCPIP